MKAHKKLENPADVAVTEEEARMLFLVGKCWQNAMENRGPFVEGLSLHMEKIIAEFDLRFGQPQIH